MKRGRGRPRLSDEEKEQRKQQREAERQHAEEAQKVQAARILNSKPDGSSQQAQKVIDDLFARHIATVADLERAKRNCRAGTRAFLDVVSALADEERKFSTTLQKLGIVSSDLSAQSKPAFRWTCRIINETPIVFDMDSEAWKDQLWREELDKEFGTGVVDMAKLRTASPLPSPASLQARNVPSS